MSARGQAPDPLEEALVDYLWARHAKRRGAAADCVNAVARTFAERAAAPAGRAHHCEAESVVATRPLTDEEFLARAGVYECARCGRRFPVVSSGNPRRLSALGVHPRPRRRAVVGGATFCEKCAPKRPKARGMAMGAIEYAAAADPDRLR